MIRWEGDASDQERTAMNEHLWLGTYRSSRPEQAPLPPSDHDYVTLAVVVCGQTSLTSDADSDPGQPRPPATFALALGKDNTNTNRWSV